MDEYPNEVEALPKNLQHLVTEAMQTITLEPSTPSFSEVEQSCSSDIT